MCILGRLDPAWVSIIRTYSNILFREVASPRIITTHEMMTDGLLVSDVRGLGVDYNNAMHLRTDRLTSSERIHRATVAADSEHHV